MLPPIGHYRGSRRLGTAEGQARLGSGEEDGLVRVGHHVHEFAFDRVLVVEQEPALPAGGIESRLAEPFLLNGPPSVPRIDTDLVLSASIPLFCS
jgi:hypothetical protein